MNADIIRCEFKKLSTVYHYNLFLIRSYSNDLTVYILANDREGQENCELMINKFENENKVFFERLKVLFEDMKKNNISIV